MLRHPIVSTLLILTGLFSAPGTALGASSSAQRPPGVPAETLIRAAQERSRPHSKTLDIAEKRAGTGPVVWAKTSFEKATWDRVPTLPEGDLQASFETVREKMVFTDENGRRRRAAWLYPDDGCFVRATVADDIIAKLLHTPTNPLALTAKIFAFGNLEVSTSNSPNGEVQWWYHVAAIAKVTKSTGAEPQDEYFVFDPAINPKAPMPVRAWLSAMNDSSVEIAICAGGAYDPDSQCESNNSSARQNSLSRAYQDVGQFLSSEWLRLAELGRNPGLELGDNPPWKLEAPN